MSNPPNIHPTAIIEEGAAIHPTAKVGAFSMVGRHVLLEEGVTVGPHAVITGHATLRAHARAFQFTSIGEQPQDLKFRGEPGRVIIGEGTMLREYVCVHIGTANGRMETRIGKHCLIMANSHVAHDCDVGDDVIIAGGTMLAGHVTVGAQATISGLVGLHQFVRVGRNAFVAAGAICVQDVMPFCFAQGDRARLRGINLEGLRRRDYGAERMQAIKNTYRILFREGRTLDDAIRTLGDHPHTEDAQDMLRFATTNKRSLMRP
jgi:UDP-N-acetylglucosamine acyltransferase